MWGFGGRYYWGRNEIRGKLEGVVVVFAWMSSEERHLSNYVRLYGSLGWKSLVCHSQFLNMFFPEKAMAIATEVLNALVQELKIRPYPVVFASFSGGPKACMYKMIEILEGKCEAAFNPDDIQLVRDCMSGYIYDSSPVDFTSDLGTRFVVHPSVLKISHPPRVLMWMANSIASGLDSLFLNRFEAQRAKYWQILYSSVRMRAPYLILCSRNDDLAPYQIICNFANRLQELGADVKLVTWDSSPHVGHYKHHPIDYEAAVTELLGKAAAIYSQRNQGLEGSRIDVERMDNGITESNRKLIKSAMHPWHSSEGLVLALNDQYLPSSMAHCDGGNVGSVQNNSPDVVAHLTSAPSINAHGILGQILFDVCVPKDVDNWDIKQSDYLNRRRFISGRRHTPFNPLKCILRSRL